MLYEKNYRGVQKVTILQKKLQNFRLSEVNCPTLYGNSVISLFTHTGRKSILLSKVVPVWRVKTHSTRRHASATHREAAMHD